MKIIIYELKKIWASKKFIAYLFFFLCTNLFLIAYQSSPLNSNSFSMANLKMRENLQGKTIQQQYDFVSDELEKIKNFNTLAYTQDTETYIPQEHIQLFKQGSYLNYTDNLQDEYFFVKDIQKEIETTIDYDTFIEDMHKKSQQMMQMPIFSNGNDYSKNKIVKTLKAYDNMKDITIKYSPQQGLQTALNFIVTDAVIFAFLLLLTYMLVKQEKDNNLINLTRCTYNGKGKTAVSKIVVLLMSLTVFVVLVYVTNFVICALFYGLGDVTRTIQSVPFLNRSTLKINVLQYMILFVLLKISAFFVLGLWFACGMLVSKNNGAVSVTCLSLPIISFVIFNAIHQTSNLNDVKYFNLVGALYTNDIIGAYRNLHWFNDIPISLRTVTTAFILIATFVLIIAFFLLYKEIKLHSVYKNIEKKRIRRNKSLFLAELKKILILNGSIFVVVLGLAFLINSSIDNQNELSHIENQYKSIITEIQTGNLKYDKQQLKDQIEFLETEQDYQEERQNIYKYYQLEALQKLHQRKSDLMIYETGFERLFHLDVFRTEYLKQLMFVISIVVLICSGIFAFEKDNNMKNLLASTPLGRSKTAKNKITIAKGLSYAMTVFAIIQEVYVIHKTYGISEIFTSMELLGFYENIPVFAMFVLQIIAQLIVVNFIVMFVLMLSQKLENFIYTVVVSMTVFVLPVIMVYVTQSNIYWLTVCPAYDIVNLTINGYQGLIGCGYLLAMCYTSNLIKEYIIDCYSWNFG